MAAEEGTSASSTVLSAASGGRTKGVTSTQQDEESGDTKHMPWSTGGVVSLATCAGIAPCPPELRETARGPHRPGSADPPGFRFLSQPPSSSGGAHQHRRRSKAPLPLEADEGKLMGACCCGGLDPCWGLLSCHCGGGALLCPGGHWVHSNPGEARYCARLDSVPSVAYGCVLHSPSYLHDTSLHEPGPRPPPPPPPQLPQMGEERTLSAVREICGRNCVGLDTEQQERLWQLLFEFRDSFALSEEEVGQTHLVQHENDTGGSRQGCVGDADFIEPSDSPWAAPVVMVPKKEGKLRFCADYRRLNEVTRKDSYPIPRIDESLDLVRGSSWFSSLDLCSGYWQVPLSPEARAKTAFSTNRGHWQFKVLYFGLCNAPATLERLMDRVLDGIPR
eukprot:XP_013992212.1 PREDICTED: uncharacterized protein LOC106567459 [Salmo salar]